MDGDTGKTDEAEEADIRSDEQFRSSDGDGGIRVRTREISDDIAGDGIPRVRRFCGARARA